MNSLINIIQQIYNQLHLSQQANIGDLIGLSLLLVLLLGALFFLLAAKKSPSAVKQLKHSDGASEESLDSTEESLDSIEDSLDSAPELPVKQPKVSWQQRLRQGLSRSRSEIWGKFGSIFSGEKLDADKLEEIEELLYSSDMGPEMVTELIDQLSGSLKDKQMNLDDFKQYLYEFLAAKFGDVQSKVTSEFYTQLPEKKPHVIMVVGVNGAGKTTTIGKLATKLKRRGAKVVVGACDTFRAAAVDQLEVWCQRAEVEMVRAKEGTNPSGVAYDALQRAIKAEADYCILDTAGRLHTATNLMEELRKMKRVVQKLDPDAPQDILLVIDAVTGQNAMRQAEEFNAALGLTGLIFTKCDGSSKAGGAVGIVNKLQVPILYIGVGEDVEDLDIFNQHDYLTALLDIESAD